MVEIPVGTNNLTTGIAIESIIKTLYLYVWPLVKFPSCQLYETVSRIVSKFRKTVLYMTSPSNQEKT